MKTSAQNQSGSEAQIDPWSIVRFSDRNLSLTADSAQP